MRQFLTFMEVLIGGFIVFCISSHDAEAGPVPGLSAPILAPTLIEKAGNWRRYCRHNDCDGPDVVLPDVDVDVAAPDVVIENPPIIVIVPVRPVSCGQYRYWDGERCVDARYNNPYVGPR
jgi:hypothetical protein